MRICSGAGCMAKVPDDVRFCGECASEQPTTPYSAKGLKLSGNQRANTDPLQREYQSQRWRKGIRPRVLQRYPFCVDCSREPSTVVDHVIPAHLVVAICKAEKLMIDPVGGFYMIENLRGRCHSCHNAKTKIEGTLDWSHALNTLLAPWRKAKQ